MNIQKYEMGMTKEDYENQQHVAETVQGLATLSKSVKESVITIDRDDLRILVDSYYQTQKFRIGLQNQKRSIDQKKDQDNSKFLSRDWILNNMVNQEAQIKKMIDTYTSNNEVCRWAKSTIGIGPMFAAALYAYLDIEGKTKVTQFWSYCGLNDNNTPWLGVEAGKKLVAEVLEEMKEKYQNIISDTGIFDGCKDTEIKKATKLIANHWKSCEGNENEFEQTIDILINREEFPTSIGYSIGELDLEDPDVMGMLKFITDNDMITNEVICMVAEATNRNVESVEKGSIDATKTESDGYIVRTKKSMESFLAKPPYNIELKKICYLIGESFCKVSNKEKSLYGRLYRQRKLYEEQKNLNHGYQDQAFDIISKKKFDKTTTAYKCYEQGMLPPGHINMRAKRYAAKMFISHFFECYYEWYYREPAPAPYVIKWMGHEEYIPPENPYSDFIGIV